MLIGYLMFSLHNSCDLGSIDSAKVQRTPAASSNVINS